MPEKPVPVKEEYPPCDCDCEKQNRCPTCMQLLPRPGELRPDSLGCILGLVMGALIMYMLMAWFRS